MKKVYAVSSGSYSDYSVFFTTSTKKLAEQMIKKLNGLNSFNYDEFFLEEFPCLESEDEYFQKTIYTVQVDWDGVEYEGKRRTHKIVHWQDYQELPIGELDDWYKRGTLVWSASDRGYDVAVKAARDKIAQVKARIENVG